MFDSTDERGVVRNFPPVDSGSIYPSENKVHDKVKIIYY